MKRITRVFLLTMLGLLPVAFGQTQSQVKQQRRPGLSEPASLPDATKPSGDYFSILNGLPMLLELHHDTEVGTNKPINVYMFVIEMQVMNSDGNLEPVGLQIHNYFTSYAQNASGDVNPHNARDCKIWAGVILNALKTHDPKSATWPYVQFITAQGARVLQTNEDGPVYWSDDIECWGSLDRFPPF